MPPADAMAKLAKAFDVTMDHLYHDTGTPHAQHDKATLDRWAILNQLTQQERDRILSVMDALVRDAKTRQNYSNGGQEAAS